MKYTSWIATPYDIARGMLQFAELGSGDVIYDLGSGDARMLILAVEEFKAKKAVGYEIREDLYQTSLREIDQRHLQDKVLIIKGDLYEANLSEASVITLYLSNEANELLRPKLEKELRFGTRVVSLTFKIDGWQVSNLTCGVRPPYHALPRRYGLVPFHYPIYLYNIPDAFQ